MTAVTCELLWIINLLSDLKVKDLIPVNLFGDNPPAMQIAANPVHHERTKHFDLDWHVVREKVSSGVLKTVKIESSLNITDLFTKGLTTSQHDFLCEKLKLYDVFSNKDCGGVIK